MTRRRTSAIGALFFVAVFGCGEFITPAEQYLAQFDGTVVARTDHVYRPRWTRNFVNRYVVRDSGGREQVFYADPSIGGFDGFAVGSHVRKQRWRMDYEVDGRRRDDFPLPFYFFWMMFETGLMAACVILAIMIQARERSQRELEDSYYRAQENLFRDDRDS